MSVRLQRAHPSCLDQFLSRAFAQLTIRESLRDIEACNQGAPPRIARQLRAQQFGRCQRAMRLTAVLRVRPSVDSYCTEVVRDRAGGPGTGQHSVCGGFHHDRSVFGALPVVPVSLHQDRDQAAYAAGFSRCHPQFYFYFQRQMVRCQRPRHFDPRCWSLPCDGPAVFGFRAALRAASKRRVLGQLSQAQLEYPAHCLQDCRAQHGTDLRSDRDAEQFLRRL
jgi:hypothetical protein